MDTSDCMVSSWWIWERSKINLQTKRQYKWNLCICTRRGGNYRWPINFPKGCHGHMGCKWNRNKILIQYKDPIIGSSSNYIAFLERSLQDLISYILLKSSIFLIKSCFICLWYRIIFIFLIFLQFLYFFCTLEF